MKPTLTRRQFTATVSSMAVAAENSFALAAPLPALLIDTHLHCFAGPDAPRFPYHPDAPYQPQQKATPEHLLQCMDAAGVNYGVIVHPEPYQDDHRYLEHCLAVGQGRLKGTVLLFAGKSGSIEQLPELAANMDLVAARVHAHTPGRLPPFGKPAFRQLWEQATQHGLAMQLHFIPKYAAGFEPYIRDFPDTPVVIDHLGRPLQGTRADHDSVLRWSKYPNTVIKLSTLTELHTQPAHELEGIIKRVTAAFGPDRMIFGGEFDHTSSGPSYRNIIERAAALLQAFPTADRAKVLGENAARLYKFTRS